MQTKKEIQDWIEAQLSQNISDETKEDLVTQAMEGLNSYSETGMSEEEAELVMHSTMSVVIENENRLYE